ncbi:MAG: hypothetical protein RLZZ436_2176 [Planctomycetota bacterium]|jgi:hypothetical protein
MSIPGNGACPPGQRGTRSGPGPHRPIDIDRTPFMIQTRRVSRKQVLRSIRNTRKPMPLGGSLRYALAPWCAPPACGVSSALAGHFTRGLPPCGSSVAASHWPWLSLNRRKKVGKASWGCQSPGNGPQLRGQRRCRSAPGWYRPIDIDRTPCMIGSRLFNGERVRQHIRNARKPMPRGLPPGGSAFSGIPGCLPFPSPEPL